MINCALGQSTSPIGLITRISVLAAGLFVSGLFVSNVFAQVDQKASLKTTEFQDLPVTVESGDTFSSIISRELNSLDAWGEIARYNKLDSPDLLQPGDVIVIPGELLRLKNYATVVFVKGSALHHDAESNAKVKVKKGDRIYTGDLIETDNDGFVSMSFNGGSSVNIQPESIMKINVLECVDREVACEVLLESSKGRLGLDVKSVGFEKPTVFNISSPYASAAVRGTRFDFDINDGNILGVTEGTVEISVNGVSNDIGAGKGVLAGEGRSINTVFDLLEPPKVILRDGINRISSEDIINWQPLNGAANYLVAFAADDSMQEVISSSSETGLYIKPELSLGKAFVSLRAVASNGLRGFSSQREIVVVDIDEAAEEVALDISIDESNEMRITAAGSASDDVEIKIGNALEILDSGEYILAEQVLHMKGGETQTVQVDSTSDWYLQARKVLDANTVSPYGLLYLYEKTEG